MLAGHSSALAGLYRFAGCARDEHCQGESRSDHEQGVQDSNAAPASAHRAIATADQSFARPSVNADQSANRPIGHTVTHNRPLGSGPGQCAPAPPPSAPLRVDCRNTARTALAAVATASIRNRSLKEWARIWLARYS